MINIHYTKNTKFKNIGNFGWQHSPQHPWSEQDCAWCHFLFWSDWLCKLEHYNRSLIFQKMLNLCQFVPAYWHIKCARYLIGKTNVTTVNENWQSCTFIIDTDFLVNVLSCRVIKNDLQLSCYCANEIHLLYNFWVQSNVTQYLLTIWLIWTGLYLYRSTHSTERGWSPVSKPVRLRTRSRWPPCWSNTRSNRRTRDKLVTSAG